MPRMQFDPNIIVVDNGNGIVRTDIGSQPGDELVQDYYPKDLRDLGKPEQTDNTNKPNNSRANSEK